MRYTTETAENYLQNLPGTLLWLTCSRIYDKIQKRQADPIEDVWHHFDLDVAKDLMERYRKMASSTTPSFSLHLFDELLEQKHFVLRGGSDAHLQERVAYAENLFMHRRGYFSELEIHAFHAVLEAVKTTKRRMDMHFRHFGRRKRGRRHIAFCGAANPALRAFWGLADKTVEWERYAKSLEKKAEFWGNLPSLTTRLWLGFDMERF